MDSYTTDVHERVQPIAFDAALAQRLAQLSPDLVYVFDMQAQRNVYANPRLLEILGLTPHAVQALGEALFDTLLHPDDRLVQQAASERALRLADGQYSEVRYRMRHADGSWRWLDDRVTVVSRDADGRVRLILGTARDVTRERAREQELDRRAEALERERLRLQVALSAGALALWELDVASGRLHWDDACWSLFGFARDGVAPSEALFSSHIAIEDRPAYDAAYQRALAVGAAHFSWVFRFRRPDGVVRRLAADHKLLRDDQGELTTVVGITRDVTEDVERREALLHSEQRFRLALTAARMVVFTQDTALRYTWIHGPALPESTQVLGRTDLDLFDPAQAQRLSAVKQRVMQLRQRVTTEVQLSCNGATQWWALTIEPVFNAGGGIDGVIGAAVEVTDARAAQAQLAASEARYRGFAQSVPQLLWSADGHGSPDDFNDRWTEFTGMTVAQCCRKGWRVLLHPDDHAVLRAAWQRALHDAQPMEARHRLRSAGGTYRWFLSRAVPECDADGQVRRWYGSSTDVHDLEELGHRLAAGEQHYRTLTDSLPLQVWETDARGRTTFVNQRYEADLGLTLADAQAGGWREAVHPADRAMTQRVIGEALASAAAMFTLENRMRVARSAGRAGAAGGDGAEVGEGGYRWFRHRGQPVHDERGRISSWIGTSDDIHEEKLLGEALIENEARLRLTMGSMGIGTFTLELQGGALWADDAAALMHGFDGEYTFGDAGSANRHVHPDDRAPLERSIAAAIAQAAPLAYEYRVIDPVDESVRWIATRGTLLARERRYVGIVQDVTALRVAAAERDTSLALLSAMVDNAPAGVTIVDRELRHLLVNDAAAALAGHSRLECLGRTVPEVVGAAGWTVMEPFYRRVIEGNETISSVEVSVPAQASESASASAPASASPSEPGSASISALSEAAGQRTLLVNYFPVREGEHTIGMGVIASDITERKAAERELLAAKAAAEQASRAKDRFLAALSHELRTPLSPIELSAHILETNPDDAALVRNRAAVIRRNVATEVRLIDDLLDVTRIAAGKLQLQMQSLDLHEVLMHTVEVCEPAAETKAVRLSVHLTAAQHHVQGDAARLQQVFWNLLSNAIKFSPQAARIDIDTLQRGDMVQVRVRDQGIGIAAEHLTRLFDPFEQGPSDVNRRYGGLGLGLAITHGLVRAHGGSVEVASAGAGCGATFTVCLPLETVSPGVSVREALLGPAPQAQAPAVGHVLLIEDHADTLETMRWLLTNDGWRVTAATNAREARAAVASERFDLIVSDLGLPDADGLDLMPQLQALHRVPAIALTGFGSEVDQKKTLAAGFALHLTKPVDLGLLTSSMRALVAVAA